MESPEELWAKGTVDLTGAKTQAFPVEREFAAEAVGVGAYQRKVDIATNGKSEVGEGAEFPTSQG